MVNTRLQNLMALVKLPLIFAGLFLGMIWFVIIIIPLFVIMIFTLVPAELLLILSIFVGLVSPDTGHKMASCMEPAVGILDSSFDFLFSPIDKLIEAVGFFNA